MPAEHLGPIEKQGKYSKIYVYRTDNIYFVPVYFEHDGERYVKFVHLKVGASEPLTHHSNPVSREEAEAEINVLIDNLAEAIKKGGEIPDYLRQALRKNFMFFKSNPHPLVSSGNFDVKYIDSATGKTVEKTILAREQFDLYKQQREGKINIISIHPSASSGNPDGLKREDDRILRPPF